MTLEQALVGARWLHYWACLGLFGAALFHLYAGPARQLVAPRLSGRTVLLAGVALFSAVAWFEIEAVNFGGDWMAALDPSTLSDILAGTDFGRAWVWRMGLALALVIVATLDHGPSREGILLGLSALLLGSLAMTGHAARETGLYGLIHRAADAGHLLGAGAWLGALLPLARLIALKPDIEIVTTALRRFSSLGIGAVCLLLASGFANLCIIAGGPWLSLQTGWGQVLAVKLALVTGLIALALVNRLVLMPGGAFARIRTLIIAEQVLGLAVLAAVSLLGTLSPEG
jgi:putative copper resistance protein D